jgi:hypothetical protein
VLHLQGLCNHITIPPSSLHRLEPSHHHKMADRLFQRFLVVVWLLLSMTASLAFMSHEFSSTRYFTDRGFLPPLDHGVMGSLLLSSSSSKNKNHHHHQHHHRQHPQHPRGSPTNQTSDLDTTTDTSMSISSSSSLLSYPSLHGRSVPVTYTNDPKTVYRWMSDHLPYEGCTIGFDIEVSDCWDS